MLSLGSVCTKSGSVGPWGVFLFLFSSFDGWCSLWSLWVILWEFFWRGWGGGVRVEDRHGSAVPAHIFVVGNLGSTRICKIQSPEGFWLVFWFFLSWELNVGFSPNWTCGSAETKVISVKGEAGGRGVWWMVLGFASLVSHTVTFYLKRRKEEGKKHSLALYLNRWVYHREINYVYYFMKKKEVYFCNWGIFASRSYTDKVSERRSWGQT